MNHWIYKHRIIVAMVAYSGIWGTLKKLKHHELVMTIIDVLVNLSSAYHIQVLVQVLTAVYIG